MPDVAGTSSPLPRELTDASTIRLVENTTWASLFGMHADSYRFEPGGLVATGPRRLFFRAWRYEVRDAEGRLRFTVDSGLRWPVLKRLRIFGADGGLLGRIDQCASLTSIRFDAFDAQGNRRLQFTQPMTAFTHFYVRRDGVDVAGIARDFRPRSDAQVPPLVAGPAFDIVDISPSLDACDRTLLLVGALSLGRVYLASKAG